MNYDQFHTRPLSAVELKVLKDTYYEQQQLELLIHQHTRPQRKHYAGYGLFQHMPTRKGPHHEN